MTREETLGKILYRGLVPILLQDDLPAMDCLEQVVSLGMEAVEISCRRTGVLRLITQAKQRFPQLAIGAAALLDDGPLRDHMNATGTTIPSVAQAVDAGADFLVSMLPFREPIYESYRDTHIIVPACSTPGEGHQALDWGANLLKFFNPQIHGGPAFFKVTDAITYGAFPFFTTGTARFELLPGYVAAGVLVCGAGFDIILGPDYRPMQRAFDEEYVIEGLNRFLRPVERSRRLHFEDVPFESKDARAIGRATGRCLNI